MAVAIDQGFASVVREALHEFIGSGLVDDALADELLKTLREYPNAFHPKAQLRSATLTVGAYRAAGGEGYAGILAGAAAEAYSAALCVYDGLTDGDRRTGSTDHQVAPALMVLASCLLERLRHTTGMSQNWGPVYGRLLKVGAGQFDDVQLQAAELVGLEQARDMTEAKTGAYGDALALVGAIAAGAEPHIQATLGLFGHFIGTCGQLIDDISDATTVGAATSDIALRKKTLPIVFFLSTSEENLLLTNVRRMYLAGDLSDADQLQVRIAIEESGAVQFCLTLANWYLAKAEAVLQDLESQRCDTSLLRALSSRLYELPAYDYQSGELSTFRPSP